MSIPQFSQPVMISIPNFSWLFHLFLNLSWFPSLTFRVYSEIFSSGHDYSPTQSSKALKHYILISLPTNYSQDLIKHLFPQKNWPSLAEINPLLGQLYNQLFYSSSSDSSSSDSPITSTSAASTSSTSSSKSSSSGSVNVTTASSKSVRTSILSSFTNSKSFT